MAVIHGHLDLARMLLCLIEPGFVGLRSLNGFLWNLRAMVSLPIASILRSNSCSSSRSSLSRLESLPRASLDLAFLQPALVFGPVRLAKALSFPALVFGPVCLPLQPWKAHLHFPEDWALTTERLWQGWPLALSDSQGLEPLGNSHLSRVLKFGSTFSPGVRIVLLPLPLLL